MANVFELSKVILEKTGSLSGKKLQKLVYYCQSWHVTALDERLIDDVTLAWEHGPVVSQLWGRHRYALSISAEDLAVEKPELDAASMELIDKVVAYYARYSGDELEEMTHAELPWASAWAAGRNTVITTEAMRVHFSGVLARNESHPELPVTKYTYVTMDDFKKIESEIDSSDGPSRALVALMSRRHSG